MKISKKILALPIIASIICITVNADDFTQSADIEIVEGLNVTETQRMNFGVVERPVGNSVIAVATSDANNHSKLTANYIDMSPVQHGRYLISGSSNRTINISTSDVNNIAGLDIKQMWGSYKRSGQSDLSVPNYLTGVTNAFPPAEGSTAYIGASIEIDPSVNEGEYQPQFNLTVSYD